MRIRAAPDQYTLTQNHDHCRIPSPVCEGANVPPEGRTVSARQGSDLPRQPATHPTGFFRALHRRSKWPR
jgi:hypothetical protein